MIKNTESTNQILDTVYFCIKVQISTWNEEKSWKVHCCWTRLWATDLLCTVWVTITITTNLVNANLTDDWVQRRTLIYDDLSKTTNQLFCISFVFAFKISSISFVYLSTITWNYYPFNKQLVKSFTFHSCSCKPESNVKW